ncbi:hypothetical protein [Spirosoma liriopis]|uniref:hypothetical protein n=1 Tax=Spirosoma liriopis TaxID=2937440 RepID=UPI0020BE5615|nr:hypothetical protein [Spirosoma liriopis]
MTSSDVLTEIMLVKKSPRIVLRVPNTRKGVTNTQGTTNPQSNVVNPVIVRQAGNGRASAKVQFVETQYDETALYNAIEKQLFKEGFSVRDRGLFNQVLDANQGVAYSKISSLTDTDLILELVRLDNPVGYTTNVCNTEPDNQQRLINDYRDMRGASVEFKLVHVRTNEIVGSYKIHYTPCLEGCRGLYKKAGSKGVFVNSPWLKPGEKTEQRRLSNKANQELDQDELESFITDATHQLVKTMR